jgi:2-aminoadipate transaminase
MLTPMLTVPAPQLARRAAQQRSSVVRDLLDQSRRPGMLSLAGGLPAVEALPVDAMKAAAARVLDRVGPLALQYGPTRGEPALLDLLPAGSCVTTGSQQGLDLVARTLLDPGDRIVVSAPDYLGLLGVLRSADATPIPVATDTDGMDADAAVAAIEAHAPKALYVVVSFHNPTSASLHPDRARRIGEAAAAHGTVVIVDDPYGALWYDAPPPALDFGPATTVRLGTASKVLAPGLRVAWLTAPEWLLEAIVVAKQFADLHSPTLNQLLAAELLGDDEWFPAHVDGLRRRYRERRDALVTAVAIHLSDAVCPTPGGGMFCWVRLPGTDTDALLPAALDAGTAYAPGSAFTVDGAPTDALRLSFASAPPADLDEAMRRLATALP